MAVPGSKISTMPFPVADTHELPKPMKLHRNGDTDSDSERSDSMQDMCVDAQVQGEFGRLQV